MKNAGMAKNTSSVSVWVKLPWTATEFNENGQMLEQRRHSHRCYL